MSDNQNGPDLSGRQQSNQQNQQQYTNQQPGQQPNQNQQQGQYQQPINVNINVPPPGYVPKSKVAAGILGILLGSLGIHNFYLGFKGKAIAQLLITLLTCGFGAAITSIWGLVEGIIILTSSVYYDAYGVPLSQ